MSKAVEQAYAMIKHEILTGRLKPGDRLREEELTRRTGVSRTPVREALRRLERDGYAVVEPNRGAHVPVLSPREFEDVLELGLLLEVYAVRLAARRITPDQIESLRALNDKARVAEHAPAGEADAPGPDVQRTELVRAFHEALLAASGNARLAAIGAQLAHTVITVRMIARFSAYALGLLGAARAKVIDAIESGDPDKAEAAVRAHVQAVRNALQGGDAGGAASPAS